MDSLVQIFAVGGAVALTWYVARHGITWVWQKLRGTEQAAVQDYNTAKAKIDQWRGPAIGPSSETGVTGVTGSSPPL